MSRLSVRRAAPGIAGATMAIAALLVALPSAAFVFPEHRWLSDQAVAHVLHEMPSAKAHLATLRSILPNNTCAGEAFFGANRLCDPRTTGCARAPLCFAIGDLPALAGDHSASSNGLLSRWFTPDTGDENGAISAIFDFIGGYNFDSHDPSLCAGSKPETNIKDFLATVSSYDIRYQSTLTGLDFALQSHDAEYLCMAQRGHTHFRIPGVTRLDAADLDVPNALATYRVYHEHALELAREACGSPEKHPTEEAAALVEELYAVHFIEDSAAAGHTVTPVNISHNGTIRRTHDYYNSVGLMVSMPAALCRELDYAPPKIAERRRGTFPKLHTVCANQGRKLARIRGDYAIAERLSTEDPRTDDVTIELATLLATTSIEQVIAVLDGAGSAPDAWEALHQDLALEMLPDPAEPVEPQIAFAGLALTLSLEGHSPRDISSYPAVSSGFGLFLPPTQLGFRNGFGIEVIARFATSENTAQAGATTASGLAGGIWYELVIPTHPTLPSIALHPNIALGFMLACPESNSVRPCGVNGTNPMDRSFGLTLGFAHEIRLVESEHADLFLAGPISVHFPFSHPDRAASAGTLQHYGVGLDFGLSLRGAFRLESSNAD